jgi:hypothetical protein
MVEKASNLSGSHSRKETRCRRSLILRRRFIR